MHIDWYTYTIPCPSLQEGQEQFAWFEDLRAIVPDYIDKEQIVWGSSKRPGSKIGANVDNHTYIFVHHQGIMTIEHTGKGCREFESILPEIIKCTAKECTRLDLANDYYNPDMQVTPQAIAESATVKRSSAIGLQQSQTGETVYVGSRKSYRYTRIYQYRKPHPRSDYMRIEYVFRKEYARAMALHISSGKTLDDIGTMAYAAHKFQHPLVAENTDANTVKIDREERTASKTVLWLYSQAAPALKRLVDAGDMNLGTFVQYVKEIDMSKPAKIHDDQLSMFDDSTDYGKPIEKETKGRWYVITRNWNTEALYMIDGKHVWATYDPLESVPHAFNSSRLALNVARNFKHASVREWPYGVLKPGRSK